jgi:hypothetical protein
VADREPIIPKPGHVERWEVYTRPDGTVYGDSLCFTMAPATDGGFVVEPCFEALDSDDLRELYHPSVVAEVQRRLGIKAEGQ